MLFGDVLDHVGYSWIDYLILSLLCERLHKITDNRSHKCYMRCGQDVSETAPSPEPILRASKRFYAADADVIFQSCDGILFHVHRKNLEVNTEGFPPAGFDTEDDIVALSEQSETLELLFQFVYPARHPYLASVEFETLAQLAEAAEKYQAYPAMNICRIRMMNTLPEHAEEIMTYAVKHDYPEIMGVAAPLLLHKSLEDILENLPPNLVIPWTRYHKKWIDCIRYSFACSTVIHDNGLTVNPPSYNGIRYTTSKICRSCNRTPETAMIQVFGELIKGTISLKNLDRTFNPSFVCCDNMKPAFSAWRSAVEAEIRKIPSFVTFL